MKASRNIYNEVLVKHDCFEIQPANRMLVDVSQRANVLEYSDMTEGHRYYHFIYNTNTHQIEKGFHLSDYAGLDHKYQQIILPKETANLKDTNQIELINAQSREGSFGITRLGEAYYLRLAGQKPLMNVAGDIYEVDLNRYAMQRIFSPYEDIMFTSLKAVREGIPPTDCLKGCYNYVTHALTELPAAGHNLPADTVIVLLPYPHQIDPVGLALKQGLPPYYFLPVHPIQRQYTAKLVFDNLSQQEKYQEHCRNRPQQKTVGQKGDRKRKSNGRKLK